MGGGSAPAFIFKETTYTLNRGYKWLPYIFEPVQKVKIALTKSNSMKRSKALSRLCKLCHFKLTGEWGNLRVILVRLCGPVFWDGCAGQFFETYPNHIPGLRKK